MPRSVPDDTLRTAVGAAAVVAGIVTFTDHTPRSLAPVLALSVAMLGYGAADEAYDLPDGAAPMAYGAALVLAGAALAIETATPLGGAAAVVGLWFLLDGAVTVRYGPARPTHEFVAGPESAALSRLRTLETVHRALRGSDAPRTPAALADACGLPEPRVESALDYLARRGRVARTDGAYRAVPRAWGRATPLVRFVAWLPRRLLRPLRRLRDGE